jgi:hypothetical protein
VCLIADPSTDARDLVRTGTLSEARPGMIGEARSSTVALFATSQARGRLSPRSAPGGLISLPSGSQLAFRTPLE